MSTYILVHGAWHGGWCWDKVEPLLQQAGHTTVAPDLPGHGQDQTPVEEVAMSSYVDGVCRAMDAHATPAILVGHSLAGAVITQVAEERPEDVEKLVYLCAFLPGSGESVVDWLTRDEESILLQSRVPSPDGKSSTIRDEAIEELFYADCPDEDVSRARSLLVPQPSAPATAPVDTTERNFGQLPRVYIETLQDRVISPSLQRQMQEAQPCDEVITMDTSHSPFFAAPDVLAAHLASLSSV